MFIRFFASVLFVVLGICHCYAANGEEIYELGEVTVTAKVVKPMKQVGDAIYSGTKITRQGIDIKGVAATTSIYEAVDLLPGVLLESTDPYGLGIKNMRCRGIKGMFGSITIDGIPDYGIMPVGPRQSIFDTENLSTIGLYKGASPSDLGTGNGNKGGSIELDFRRPGRNPGLTFEQHIGTNYFSRTFVRLESGLLPTNTSMFISYSYTDADKWKGTGETGPRNHVDAGVFQDIGPALNIYGVFSFNDADTDLFRPLVYKEAIELEDYYRLDFAKRRTGLPALDRYYYKYHTSSATNRDLRFIINAEPSDFLLVSIKPYYSNEDAWLYQTVTKELGAKTKYFLLKKIRDLNRIGVISELNWRFPAVTLTTGYWYESPGLDKFVKKSAITNTGLKELAYSYYAENHGRGTIHSPFLKIAGSVDRFKWQAGFKYFYYKEPSSTGYLTESGHLVQQPDLSLEEQSWDVWLPSLGFSYTLTEQLDLYCNYGRTYTRPYMFVPITNLYVENRSKFNRAGIVLQDIFDSWDMEISDNIDLGFRFNWEGLEFNPTFFYAWHHNLLVNAYDPKVGINYYKNDGEARACGFELNAVAYLPWDIQLLFMPSYTDLKFSDDIMRSGNKVKIDGKQVPDTPKWILKGGLIYSWEDFRFSTLVKWITKRYGDVLHEEAIPSHATVDLSLKYSRQHLWRLTKASIELEIKNLFDSHHIGIIDLLDDTTSGKASYYAGAPFSAIITLTAQW